jgi:murein DD-endopeptidase MepM/ murein hydrolase activator NlpD
MFFPVDAGGAPSFADEFGAKHLGADIFAPKGTAVRAVDAGAVRFGTDPLGGNVANLTAADGTRYYYAHLSTWEGASRSVNAGDVIGYVGNTGNAASTSPHLHFEIHPGGGAAVDPFPILASVAPPGAAKGVARASAATPATAAASGGGLAILLLLWWWSKRRKG